MNAQHPPTEWRATGPYTPSISSKAGLLGECRLFLHTYGQLGDLPQTRAALIQGGLPQRSRATRATIMRTIQERLTRWQPPAWVLGDLAGFAQDTYHPSLEAALLLHVVRQNSLLYDVAQGLLAPRWHAGTHTFIRSDIQRFLDQALPAHPEINGWSHQTREKVAGNVLSVLRDYGLMRGREVKTLIAPAVPPAVAQHLVRLLQAEGIGEDAIPSHPDWNIWLWEPQRVADLLAAAAAQERAA